MMTLKDWFSPGGSASPITDDYNPVKLSTYYQGEEQPTFFPPPQVLYDLGSYRTPYRFVWCKPRNVLT